MRTIRGILFLAAVALTACGKKPETVKVPAADSLGGMGAMGMASQGVQMMPLMRAHLDSLGAMDPTQMAAAMTAHLSLASRMMSAMGADMQGRNVKPDAAWSVLSDSLRQDLADLPALKGAPLKSRMQGHIGRMQRIMSLHQGMMQM